MKNHLKIQIVMKLKHLVPVATIMPYDNLDEAIQLSRMGKGSLVSSIITNDMKNC